MSALPAIAELLYAGAPEEFTQRRTAEEKQAKAADDPELAKAIRALKRPSIGAWAVNQLVRREPDQIDQVFEVAASMRAAATALDGAQMRELTKQRRQLTHVLTTRARQLALESGSRLTGAVAEQVEATLTAAMLDEQAAAAVRSGMLVTTLAATGLGESDYSEAVAFGEALGTRAAPIVSDGPALHVVPDNVAVKRQAAKERMTEALADHRQAERSHAERIAALTQIQGRELQIQSEIDELQRRLGGLEERLEELDEERAGAEEARDEAARWLAESEAAVDAAQVALDALG